MASRCLEFERIQEGVIVILLKTTPWHLPGVTEKKKLSRQLRYEPGTHKGYSSDRYISANPVQTTWLIVYTSNSKDINLTSLYFATQFIYVFRVILKIV
jgi:hypothetical protein